MSFQNGEWFENICLLNYKGGQKGKCHNFALSNAENNDLKLIIGV